MTFVARTASASEAIATKRNPSIWGMNRFSVVMRLNCNIAIGRDQNSMRCEPLFLRFNIETFIATHF